MKLLMLFALAATMVAVQACREKSACHELMHDVMHKEDMKEIIGSCMEENGIVPDLEGRRPGGSKGKRSPHMVRFISRLPEEDQTALAECIFEKEGLLTDDGMFDATTFTANLIAKLGEAEQTEQAEAMLAAIEDGVCAVEESEPNMMLVFEFIWCLKDECKEATEPSEEE
ncbi:uncharacterized protein LOC125033340 [Penaeus chinensis]|uniref:uncharacterized protein LOC125033340 n=1 Tax=Penaeus chinensis TaxID=139456 RepID=UPI001FB6689B|nr:uncharacterized protein LOC125033340 [Penaeus chinensis]